MEQSRNKQIFVTTAVVLVIVLVVGGFVLFSNKKNTNGAGTTDSASTSTNSSTSANSNATYKDGSYTATGSYNSPGGNEGITVKVTLKDGIITETSATSGANDPTAAQYQSDFISGYKTLLVGKKISSVKLSRVSGSSLTSQGFNNALDQIKQEAQA